MSTSRPDAISMLAAADPARELQLDPDGREAVWRALALALESPRPSSTTNRRRLRTGRVCLVGATGVMLAGGVALASGLIPLGSPAKTVEQFELAGSGLGSVTPGSVRLLPVTAADPQGGAPWGLRSFTTSRGAGCIQVGRVLDGQLGVLGADGAFGDDGRLHPLPVASTDELTCVALDATGQIFNNISKSDQLANALDGPQEAPTSEHPQAHDVCVPAIATPAEKSEALGRVCQQADERDLYYGLLGPLAKSVTYLDEGRTVTTPTSGNEGAYLIVTNAAPGWRPNAFGAGATGPLPVDGPFTEIHYTNGTVCQMTPTGWDEGCAPNAVPIGYEPAARTPTAAQAAAAVTATLAHGTGEQDEAIVHLKAPLAITSVRDQYKLQWEHAGIEGAVNLGEGDVQAGQELSIGTGHLPSGTTVLHVVLAHAGGPALFEGPGTVEVPVGEVSVAVP